MANNTELNAGTGGDVIATEDISGVKYELVKPVFGGDGIATKVSDVDPFPVTDDAAETSLSSIDTKLSSQATAAKQDTGNTSLVSIDSKLTNPLPISGTITATGVSTETTLAAILAKIIAAPATEATLALIKAKTDNLDVALSTRTK